MRTSFYRKLDERSLAVLDMCEYYGRGLIITRINVPAAHRGTGVATQLLKECLSEADRTNTSLFLEIASSDGLDFASLEAWYRRHGFTGSAIGVMRRLPNK